MYKRQEDIEIFITALCELAQDEEINQRTGQIKNTITKIENDLPATGYPKMCIRDSGKIYYSE